MVPAFEIMHVNPAIRTMIRDQKVHQIDATLTMSSREGMVAMDASILELYRKRMITAETAIQHALFPEQLSKKVGL